MHPSFKKGPGRTSHHRLENEKTILSSLRQQRHTALQTVEAWETHVEMKSKNRGSRSSKPPRHVPYPQKIVQRSPLAKGRKGLGGWSDVNKKHGPKTNTWFVPPGSTRYDRVRPSHVFMAFLYGRGTGLSHPRPSVPPPPKQLRRHMFSMRPTPSSEQRCAFRGGADAPPHVCGAGAGRLVQERCGRCTCPAGVCQLSRPAFPFVSRPRRSSLNGRGGLFVLGKGAQSNRRRSLHDRNSIARSRHHVAHPRNRSAQRHHHFSFEGGRVAQKNIVIRHQNRHARHHLSLLLCVNELSSSLDSPRCFVSQNA